jgi:hypothetical protein
MEEIRDAVYLEDLMCKGEEIKYDERGNILYYRGHNVNDYTIPKRWNPDKIYRDGRVDSKIHSSDCASDFAVSTERYLILYHTSEPFVWLIIYPA